MEQNYECSVNQVSERNANHASVLEKRKMCAPAYERSAFDAADSDVHRHLEISVTLTHYGAVLCSYSPFCHFSSLHLHSAVKFALQTEFFCSSFCSVLLHFDRYVYVRLSGNIFTQRFRMSHCYYQCANPSRLEKKCGCRAVL